MPGGKGKRSRPADNDDFDRSRSPAAISATCNTDCSVQPPSPSPSKESPPQGPPTSPTSVLDDSPSDTDCAVQQSDEVTLLTKDEADARAEIRANFFQRATGSASSTGFTPAPKAVPRTCFRQDEGQPVFVSFCVQKQIDDEFARFFKDKRVEDQFVLNDYTTVHLRGFRHEAGGVVKVMYLHCSSLFPESVQRFPQLFVRMHARSLRRLSRSFW